MRLFAIMVSCLVAFLLSVQLAQAEVMVREKTNFYRITGKTTADFARSMSRRGPYSRQHRRRAWATASRDMSYQLTRTKTKTGCRIKAVKVRMKITYRMPKPASLSGVSRREQRKWARLYKLLERHERTHGKFYRRFANDTKRRLMRLRPARNCRKLDRKAAAVVKELSEADSRRNDRFDARDGKTYRRVERIYKSS